LAHGGAVKQETSPADYLTTAALIAGLAMPALAADRYYVALDTSTRQCHVMAQKPEGTMKQVGSGAYKSAAEAQAAIRSLTECNS
jgi:hypothetical protein